MTIDERIERLTERHEALAESVESLTKDVHQLTRNMDRLHILVADISSATLHLINVSRAHEMRIDALENRPQ